MAKKWQRELQNYAIKGMGGATGIVGSQKAVGFIGAAMSDDEGAEHDQPLDTLLPPKAVNEGDSEPSFQWGNIAARVGAPAALGFLAFAFGKNQKGNARSFIDSMGVGAFGFSAFQALHSFTYNHDEGQSWFGVQNTGGARYKGGGRRYRGRALNPRTAARYGGRRPSYGASMTRWGQSVAPQNYARGSHGPTGTPSTVPGVTIRGGSRFLGNGGR